MSFARKGATFRVNQAHAASYATRANVMPVSPLADLCVLANARRIFPIASSITGITTVVTAAGFWTLRSS